MEPVWQRVRVALVVSALVVSAPVMLAMLPCWTGAGQAQIMSIPNRPANQPNTQIKRDTVTGTVYNSVTSEPVRRALVTLAAAGEQLFAFTGGDGRFEIEGVPDGPALITARRPGFMDGNSNGQGVTAPEPFTVSSGTNDFRIPLRPAARITGTAVDPDGEPIAGLQIRIAAEQIMQGRKQLSDSGWVTTDENGVYEKDDLPAGTVYVQCVQAGNRLLPGGQVYPAKYYPDSDSITSAQPIALRAGEEARADFTLRPVKAFGISGVVTGLLPNARVQVWIENEEHEQQNLGNYGLNPENGRFVLRMVPAGSWILRFQANDNQGHIVEAEQPVAVADADIRGLQIALQPTIAIPVVVNSAPPPPQTQVGVVQFSGPVFNGVQVQVRLIPETARRNEQYYSQAEPNQAGAGGTPEGASGGTEAREPPRIQIPYVPAGRYRVLVQPFGMQCVDTVTSGATDLTRDPLVVAGNGTAPPPITVSTRSDCGSVTATIHSERENVAAVVLLVADSGLTEPQIQMWQPSGNGNASTMFSNLGPGDYHIYAFSNIDDLEYGNPEALRDYAGQQVSVAANGNATVTLNVIERGEQ